ncbi:MAG: hypothetical protein D6820_05730 [Lentisphaerae bacterium]|nr:MAG: hypothetical protein D6820_05730 [Lentisphaerota bacterium]
MIITILAALLLPALVRSRAMAKTVLCINNQRQCSLAIHAYTADTSDRRWLSWARIRWGWWPRFGWAYFLFRSQTLPYAVGSSSVVCCPLAGGRFAKTIHGTAWGYEKESRSYAYLIDHYGANTYGYSSGASEYATGSGWYRSTDYPDMRERFISLNRIDDPSSFILIADTVGNWDGDRFSCERIDPYMQILIAHPSYTGPAAFADGHVEKLSRSQYEEVLIPGLNFCYSIP